MKRLLLSLFTIGALFAGGHRSEALTIPASEDSSSVSGKLTTAGNTSAVLAVDATHKAYVYFDLGEVPTDAVVRWAKLRLFLPSVSVKGSGITVHKVTGVWNEALQSAEPAIAASPVATIPADKLATKRFVTVDVTATVQDWITLKTANEGFALLAVPNKTARLVTAINFASKEGILGGLPAELDIEFKPEAEAPAPITVEQLPAALRTFLAPSITVQPPALSIGGSLAVQAQGLGLSYQWMCNGVPVTAGTNAQLPAEGLRNGSYAVAVSNSFGSVISAAVQFNEPPRMVDVLGGMLPTGSELAGEAVADFQIGNYEVTWGEWKTVREWAALHGYSDLASVGVGNGDNYPVTDVSWYDVVKWCNAKSEKEGKTPVYQVSGATYKIGATEPTVIATANGYRLPTEAEWEWAARGGRQTHGYTYSGSNDVNAVAWTDTNSSGGTKAVGTKAANEIGIYDMSGNVWEWCRDFDIDPMYRRVRGGAWHNYSGADASVSLRVNRNAPQYRSETLGFRVACSFDTVIVQGGTLPSGSQLAGQTVADFQIGKTEVTWGEWKAVRDWAAAKGYSDLADVGHGKGDSHPVTWVNWYDLLKWCNAKSEKEGRTPVYQVDGATYKTGESVPTVDRTSNGYRLPTEVEWEWAARGGRQTHGYIYSGSNDINAVAWYSDNSQGATHEVGMKEANELGISDMTGNVWEWCWDLYSSGRSARLVRGGSWYDVANYSYVSIRDDNNGGDPAYRGTNVGFRLACNFGQ